MSSHRLRVTRQRDRGGSGVRWRCSHKWAGTRQTSPAPAQGGATPVHDHPIEHVDASWFAERRTEEADDRG